MGRSGARASRLEDTRVSERRDETAAVVLGGGRAGRRIGVSADIGASEDTGASAGTAAAAALTRVSARCGAGATASAAASFEARKTGARAGLGSVEGDGDSGAPEQRSVGGGSSGSRASCAGGRESTRARRTSSARSGRQAPHRVPAPVRADRSSAVAQPAISASVSVPRRTPTQPHTSASAGHSWTGGDSERSHRVPVLRKRRRSQKEKLRGSSMAALTRERSAHSPTASAPTMRPSRSTSLR